MLDIKAALKPVDTTVLATWVATNDCTKWLGVTCDASGNVLKM